MSTFPSLPKISATPIVTATCILALLHFGRDVLEPLALALILSLVVGPLVLFLRRIGLGQTASALVSVILCAVCLVGVSVILAAQVVTLTVDLPQYRAAIRLIAVTGYGQASDRARALASGFDAHLKKPVGIDDVLAAIGTHARQAP